MKYYLAHNEIDVFHYGKLEDGQEIETGQPVLEFFETIDTLNERLNVFNLTFTDNEHTNIEILNDTFDLPDMLDNSIESDIT